MALDLCQITIHVTPDPALSGLDAAHQRMFGSTVVRGGMLVLGRVATAHVSAVEAHPKMDPGVTDGDALGTFVGGGLGQRRDGGKVTARSGLGFLQWVILVMT